MSDLYDDPDEDDVDEDDERERVRQSADEMLRRVRESTACGYNARDILNVSLVIIAGWAAQPLVPWQLPAGAAVVWTGVAVLWLAGAGEAVVAWLREVTS